MDQSAERNAYLLNAGKIDDTLREKLAREADLFQNLPQKVYEKAGKTLKEEPEKAIYSMGTGAVLAMALAAANKNPGLLGQKAMPYLEKAVEKAPKVFGVLMALDLGSRIGSPMSATWRDREAHLKAKEDLSTNLGSAAVEYGAGFVGAVPGIALAARLTPAWQNKAPAFEAKPSERIGQLPREIEHPERFISASENKVSDDVAKLYEKSFPKEERQPTEEVMELVSSGRILVHTTRDEGGQLQAFSFTSLHDETAFKFANLDFIATEPGIHSKGLGSLHAKRLNDIVRTDRPELTGMTLEMEAVAEKGLNPEVFALRQRRATFYDRLDAPNTNVKYKILDFEDPSYRGPAEWRAWVYDQKNFNPVNAARLMLTDEGGYGLSPSNKAVREFDRANGFWNAHDTHKSQSAFAITSAAVFDRIEANRKANNAAKPIALDSKYFVTR